MGTATIIMNSELYISPLHSWWPYGFAKMGLVFPTKFCWRQWRKNSCDSTFWDETYILRGEFNQPPVGWFVKPRNLGLVRTRKFWGFGLWLEGVQRSCSNFYESGSPLAKWVSPVAYNWWLLAHRLYRPKCSFMTSIEEPKLDYWIQGL